jgi:hypothetical protein
MHAWAWYYRHACACWFVSAIACFQVPDSK